MRMNSALGKRILALVRGGDYAHAGEEEAIHLTLDVFPKDPARLVLDAGCGRGGTARYVQDHGWGKVTGFDIENESVERAQGLHPDLTFVTADVVEAPTLITQRFDLIYSFNAFYAFPDQREALIALRKMAKDDAALALFDYVDRDHFATSAFGHSLEAAHWKSLDLETFPQLLKDTGWELSSIKSLDAEYERWYVALEQRIESRREQIIAISDAATYEHVYQVYYQLLTCIQDGALGGAIVYAKPLI